MIGAPFLVLGVLVTLSALLGAGVAGRQRGTVADFLLSPLHPGTWAALAAVLVGFLVGITAFTVIVGLLSTGASLLVVGIGLLLIGLAIEASRLVARFERARARWADPRPLYAHPYRPYGQGPRGLFEAVFLDMARWRDVIYVFVAFPLVVLEAVVAIVLWSTAIAFLSVPLWYATGAMPASLSLPILDRLPVSPGSLALLFGLAGVALTPISASITRGLMALHRAVVSGLLCASEQQALRRRVATLETSRRAVLDVEASELRRIERDLHDGAQQRLVMLSLDLGMAAERIDTDPVAAKGLVEDARDQARLALAELRDLVRGIAPAILLDRGLVPALSALAGRGPMTTVVSSELPEGLRLPDAVERAAYFVVAEVVANAAKHAGGVASRVEVRVRLDGGSLVVEIEDDGPGGARIVPGGGLAGLADRVAALDGALAIDSPGGGPTVVRASIPVPPGGVTAWVVPPRHGPVPAPQDPR